MLKVLIATDIFGYGDVLQSLIDCLQNAGVTVQTVDPYQGRLQQFDTELSAYQAFIAQTGHDGYTQGVTQALTQQPNLAIGFSAGASALWRAVADVKPLSIKNLVLFYPGQLHLHQDKSPNIATELIFGEQEHHFNVDDMLQQLSANTTISANKTVYQHGFMNSASPAFNDVAYQYGLQRLLQVITRLKQ
ncbi:MULTISPECIES: dienelactone hydrolase family protein [Rheinheimera]|uniref:dienelactone hydrolase family protein n=1 Tax=Rheinheimera TaxID=67575 RepID=UPI001046E998|nr:dienelactone hydrolase family protein [Rheinheimera sp. D18]QBL09543.1 hypothetical protein E0Z06_08480 [Rheinheimera sp. D18]